MAQIVTCPSCNREYAARPELAGKRAKCKCGGRIEFPAEVLGEADLLDTASAAAPVAPPIRQATAPSRAMMAPPVIAPPPVQAPPPLPVAQCRNCRSPLSTGSVMCTMCGMNQQTGAMMRTTVSVAPKNPRPAERTYNSGGGGGGGGGSGMRNILIGGGLVVLGLAITIGTYSAASEKGGSYYVFYGPVIFGGIQLVRGIGQVISGD